MARLWLRLDRRALLVTALCLVVWRLLDQLTVVDVSHLYIQRRLELYSQPGFFAAIGPNSLPFRTVSVGAMGIGPFINAWIVINLLTVISTRAKAMLRDPAGRVRLQRWMRAIAIALALGQAYGWTVLDQNVGALPGGLDWSARLIICLQLTGGTAVAIMLADAIDEWGLGFGYGAWILYVLGYVATEVHRLASYLASTPSIEALYRPLAVWAIFTVALVFGGVAVLLAARWIAIKDSEVEIRLMTCGVARPTMFALGVLSVPSIIANYEVNFQPARWFTSNWGLLGPSLWLDAVYGVAEAALVVAFAVFVAVIDYVAVPPPRETIPYITRLAVLGGVFLALATVVVPVAVHVLSPSPATPIPVSGFDVVFVTAVIFTVVRSIEGRRPTAPLTASPLGIP